MVVTSCIKDPCRVKMERQGPAILFAYGLEINIIYCILDDCFAFC